MTVTATYTFDQRQSLAVTTFAHASAKEIQRLVEVMIRDPRTLAVCKHLVDLREQSGMSVGPEAAMRLAMAARAFLGGHPHGATFRTAVIAPRDLDFGLARMVTTMAARTGTFMVFRTVEEATAWLDVQWPDASPVQA